MEITQVRILSNPQFKNLPMKMRQKRLGPKVVREVDSKSRKVTVVLARERLPKGGLYLSVIKIRRK